MSRYAHLSLTVVEQRQYVTKRARLAAWLTPLPARPRPNCWPFPSSPTATSLTASPRSSPPPPGGTGPCGCFSSPATASSPPSWRQSTPGVPVDDVPERRGAGVIGNVCYVASESVAQAPSLLSVIITLGRPGT